MNRCGLQNQVQLGITIVTLLFAVDLEKISFPDPMKIYPFVDDLGGTKNQIGSLLMEEPQRYQPKITDWDWEHLRLKMSRGEQLRQDIIRFLEEEEKEPPSEEPD